MMGQNYDPAFYQLESICLGLEIGSDILDLYCKLAPNKTASVRSLEPLQQHSSQTGLFFCFF